MSNSELDEKMLMVFMTGCEVDKTVIDVSLDDQKKYLKRYIDSVNIADRQAVGDIVRSNGEEDKLKLCNEGTIVNLDALEDHIVTQMYLVLQAKKTKK
jgi:hypothetical protein